MTDIERTLRTKAELRGYTLRKLVLGDFLLIGDGGQSVIGDAEHLIRFMDEALVANVRGLRIELKEALAETSKNYTYEEYQRMFEPPKPVQDGDNVRKGLLADYTPLL